MDYYLLYLQAYLHFKTHPTGLFAAPDKNDKRAHYVICLASHHVSANLAPTEEAEFVKN